MPGDARNYFGLTLEMVGNAVMEYLQEAGESILPG